MGKKTNATRDGERVVKGWTDDVWGEKVESEGWAEGGTASRKPGEITDNGPRELELGKTHRMKGRRTSARQHGEKQHGEW